MKHFTILLILTVLISGCAKQSPTENLVDVANQTIDIMYNAIPKECRNETIDNLRYTGKEQVKLINDTCQLQKDVLWAKIHERNAIIICLIAIFLICAGANVFLKLRR